MGQKRAHTIRADALAELSIKRRDDLYASELLAQASINANAKRNAKALNILIRLYRRDHEKGKRTLA